MPLHRRTRSATTEPFTATPLPPDLHWDDDEEFQVEYIVAAQLWRHNSRARLQWVYLTKWHEWEPRFNTWEPKKNFNRCPDVIRDFWAATSVKREPQTSRWKEGKQFGSSAVYQVSQIAAIRKQEFVEGKDNHPSSVDNSEEDESQAEERLFYPSDEEPERHPQSDEETVRQLLAPSDDEDEDEEETVVPNSEFEVYNPPPVLSPSKYLEAMSMVPRRNDDQPQGSIDPRELHRLKENMDRPAAYTDIMPYVASYEPRKSASPQKPSPKRRTPKKTATRSTKSSSSAAFRHPNLYIGASPPKIQSARNHLAPKPTGFDMRNAGVGFTTSRRGERTTTVSLEDREMASAFRWKTGSSQGPTKRHTMLLGKTYGTPTGQRKDMFRSNLEQAPSSMRRVDFRDLPMDAPWESIPRVPAAAASDTDLDVSSSNINLDENFGGSVDLEVDMQSDYAITSDGLGVRGLASWRDFRQDLDLSDSDDTYSESHNKDTSVVPDSEMDEMMNFIQDA